MAQSDKISKFRKREMLLDVSICELDDEDRSPIPSPSIVTIEPSDGELNDLEASQESNVTFNNLSSSVNFDKTVGPGAAPEGFILVDEDRSVDDTDNSQSQNDPSSESLPPIFRVMFRDVGAARKYRNVIKEFLQNLISPNAEVNTQTDSSGLILEIWDRHAVMEDGETSGSTGPDNSQETVEDQLFTIDTKPKLKDDLDIPTYGKKFKKILNKHTEDGEADLPKNCAPKLSCFNCLGNHNLRDCTEPRNHANINKNRKEFTAKVGPKNGRYHLEDEQKFGHFVPGQLSKNLRRALGLRDNELPKHIYSMRILGYPPGWMEEARVQHSGLTLFNSDGNVDLGPLDEEGEIIVQGEKDEFDIHKIHDYPGFNVTPPHGTRDESRYYRSPRMQETHSKEAMLSMLSSRKVQDGYKRKKMKATRSEPVSNASIVPSEMEVEDIEDSLVETLPVNELFTPPLPKDTPPKPPEPPIGTVLENSDSQSESLKSPDSTEKITAPSPRVNSPSLSDLEVAKNALLAALDEPGTPTNPGTPIAEGKSVSLSENSQNDDLPPSVNSSDLTPRSNRVQSILSTPKAENSSGLVKTVDLGTPVLQSTTPFNKLPSSEKFSKNICDVINFENLPDSTGKYKKMSGIIQKVRDAVTKFQQE